MRLMRPRIITFHSNEMASYWISVSKWSLIDSMANECVSPFSFYARRCFGSDLARHFDESERVNHLLLSAKEPIADYAIKVDSSLLDPQKLTRVGKSRQLYLYPKSIFFQKGKVKFRFASDEMLKTFLAETEIMLEIKCTALYSEDFYVSNTGSGIKIPADFDYLPMESQEESILKEDSYNYTKGAIIAYCRGVLTTRSQEETSAIAALTSLKNDLVGLHTQIMVDQNYVPSMSLAKSIAKAEELYHKASYRKTHNFRVLSILYADLIDKANLRYNELHGRKTSDSHITEAELRREIADHEKVIRRFEFDSNLTHLVNELEEIKRAEEENGKRVGQKRKFFPKDSPEFQRKQELKISIESFKKNNKQYLDLVSHLQELQDRLYYISTGASEYDSAIATISNQISDVIANIEKEVQGSLKPVKMDFSSIDTLCNGKIKVFNGEYKEAELEYYNILLETILECPLKELRPASDVDMLNLLKVSMNRFKENGASFQTEDGQRIRSILLSYWFYKHHDPRGKVELIEEYPLINNVIAFFLKGSDFSQIERYTVNNGIKHKEYALMLMGGFVGFSSLPRTMTSSIYQLTDRYLVCQSLLSGISVD